MDTRTLTTTRYTPNQQPRKIRVLKQGQFDKDLAEWSRNYITRVLKECGGNRGEASRRTGIERTRLLKMIKKLKITVPSNGPGNPYIRGMSQYGCVFVVEGQLCGHARVWHANISAGHEYVAPPAATPNTGG